MRELTKNHVSLSAVRRSVGEQSSCNMSNVNSEGNTKMCKASVRLVNQMISKGKRSKVLEDNISMYSERRQ